MDELTLDFVSGDVKTLYSDESLSIRSYESAAFDKATGFLAAKCRDVILNGENSVAQTEIITAKNKTIYFGQLLDVKKTEEIIKKYYGSVKNA